MLASKAALKTIFPIRKISSAQKNSAMKKIITSKVKVDTGEHAALAVTRRPANTIEQCLPIGGTSTLAAKMARAIT